MNSLKNLFKTFNCLGVKFLTELHIVTILLIRNIVVFYSSVPGELEIGSAQWPTKT